MKSLCVRISMSIFVLSLVVLIGQSESFLVNKYDVALFNAIFDRRYFDAMRMLKQQQKQVVKNEKGRKRKSYIINNQLTKFNPS